MDSMLEQTHPDITTREAKDVSESHILQVAFLITCFLLLQLRYTDTLLTEQEVLRFAY